MQNGKPVLSSARRGGVTLLTDQPARAGGLGVVFTDREGGTSAPPYDSLNLAARVGDDPESVDRNRARVAGAAGFEIGSLVLARQVHGARALEVQPGMAGVAGEADILWTRTAGAVIGILTADCAPVVLAGERGVAVVHAGWRGLVAGAVEEGVGLMGTDARAWIGPSIRACCYEVGPEVRHAFRERGLEVAGPDSVDPAGAAAGVLRGCGIDSVAIAGACTACDPRYFSYRRDGVTGRQGAFVWLAKDSAH